MAAAEPDEPGDTDVADLPDLSDGAPGPSGGALPPPTVPAQDPPLRWCRSEERILFGVAGGLADALALDPLLVRLVFVGLGAFGIGIGLYLAGLLLLAPGPYGPRPSTFRKALGIAVLVLLGLIVLGGGANDFRWHGGGWWPAAIALGAAAALWYPRRTHLAIPPAGGPTTAAAAAAAPARPVARPRPPRQRSVVGRIAFAIALAIAAIGSATAGGDQGALKVVFGVAALVLGVGILVAAFSEHARWLIVPAVLAAGASVVFAAVDGLGVRLGPGDGGDTYADGSSSAPVLPRYDQRSGTINLRLSQVDHDVTTVVRMGTGNVEVDVPDDARVVLRGRVGIGQIETPERIVRGYRRRLVDDLRLGDGSGPTITLDASVGIGDLTVVRDGRLVDVSPERPTRGASPEPPTVTLPPGVEMIDPDGTRYYVDGIVLAPDGTLTLLDGTVVRPDGTREYASPVRILANGAALLPDGTLIDPDGTVHAADGTTVRAAPPGAATATTNAPTATTSSPASSAPATSQPPATTGGNQP
jgi:phage shock protein PspC (stress-responsive transcriptional regulator)